MWTIASSPLAAASRSSIIAGPASCGLLRASAPPVCRVSPRRRRGRTPCRSRAALRHGVVHGRAARPGRTLRTPRPRRRPLAGRTAPTPGTPDPLLDGDPDLRLALDDGPVLVYENRAAVPRVRIVHAAVTLADEERSRRMGARDRCAGRPRARPRP